MEQTWLTWPPDRRLTGAANLGMLRDASHLPLKTWISVLFLPVGKNCLSPAGVHRKNWDSSPNLIIPQDCS